MLAAKVLCIGGGNVLQSNAATPGNGRGLTEKKAFFMAFLQRDARFDNLKGLLIFLVVFGHLLELVDGPAAAWIYRVIYSFHMPAFVFCSGWFARFDAARFFQRLLYPYLLYQTLYLLFDRAVLHGDAPLRYTTPYWLLWYLLSMMLWMLVLPLIDGVKTPLAALLGCLAVALAAGFDPSIGYSMSLSRSLVLLPFFAAGHLAAGIKLPTGPLSAHTRRRLVLALLGWIAGTSALLWVRRGAVRTVWFYASRSYEDAHYIPLLRALLLVTSAAWIVLLLLVVPRHPLPFVAALGRNTLPVFLVHGFFVRALDRFCPNFPPVSGIALAALVSLALCAGLGNRFMAALLGPTFRAPHLRLAASGLPKSRLSRPAH